MRRGAGLWPREGVPLWELSFERWDQVAPPEDVAAQVVVLASDVLSGHVTGHVVVVAGGMEGAWSTTTEDMARRDRSNRRPPQFQAIRGRAKTPGLTLDTSVRGR